jgi:hypothetical protein
MAARQGLAAFPAALQAPLLEANRRLLERGINVTLVGGLAINLHASTVAPSSGRLDDRSLLARIGRATQDIDLAVSRPDAARVAFVLRECGYQPLRDRPGFERAGTVIDVLSLGGRRASGGAISLTIDRLSGVVWQLEDVAMRVACCAELIVLKAVAWCDRHRGADLADIGTLALIDQEMGGAARQSLDAGLDGRLHPELRRDLRRAADRFSRRDESGPRAFVQEVVAPCVDPAQLSELPDWEDVVSEIVSDAVKTVLSCVGEE